MYESSLGKGFVSFDGSVLETWQPNNDGSGRLHVAVIKVLNISHQGKDLYFMEIETIYRNGSIAFSFDEQHLPAAQKLKQLVEKAQAHSY